jgi:2'-5' RNA ligase
MSHRIFIAINLPNEIEDKIAIVQNKLKKFDWPVRWTSVDNLHITLRFLGSITEKGIDEVRKIVGGAVKKSKPFVLNIDGFIVLPGLETPRVIGLNIENSEELFKLQSSIAGAIEEQGIGEPERHPFTGHITIGRLEPARLNFRALTQMKFKSNLEIRSVEIMESKIKLHQPEYKLCSSHKLGLRTY